MGSLGRFRLHLRQFEDGGIYMQQGTQWTPFDAWLLEEARSFVSTTELPLQTTVGSTVQRPVALVQEDWQAKVLRAIPVQDDSGREVCPRSLHGAGKELADVLERRLDASESSPSKPVSSVAPLSHESASEPGSSLSAKRSLDFSMAPETSTRDSNLEALSLSRTN